MQRTSSRRIWLAAVLTFLALASTGVGLARADEWEVIFAEAEGLIRKGEYKRAVPLTSKALVIAHRGADAPYRLSRTLIQSADVSIGNGDPTTATKYLARCLDLLNQRVEYTKLKDRLTLNDEPARIAYEGAKASQVLQSRGLMPPDEVRLMDEHQLKLFAVCECYGTDYRLMPLVPQAFVTQARSYQASGEDDSAEEACREAIDYSQLMMGPDAPFTAACYWQLALIYESRKSLPLALAMARKAVAVWSAMESEKGALAIAYEKMAMWYKQEGDDAASQEAATKVRMLRKGTAE